MNEAPRFDRDDVLLWLGGQDPNDIRAVMMALGRNPDCPNFELDRDPQELLDELDDEWPDVGTLLVAIEEALAIEPDRLERLLRYEEDEPDPELELPEVDDEPDGDLG
ncbi:hypothetical protein JXB37_08065 [candidate division WOR-3 bacterium]|nr:hypothetical protein [candidate division WOR-3 bacterium]